MRNPLLLLLALLAACAPAASDQRASPFPLESEPRSFPTWRATLPAFERVALEAVRRFDPSLRDTAARERREAKTLRELSSAGLAAKRTAVMYIEEGETIVLGVLPLDAGADGRFAAGLEGAISEAADRVFPRVVFGQAQRGSKFAGFFPYDPTGRDLPVWATSLEVALPDVVAAVKAFDARYASAFGFELTDLSTNRLRIFDVRSTNLERDRIEVYVTGDGDRVALGVFEANSGGKLPPGSQAARLEVAVIAALDAKYARSPD